jgi:hypothetical protein
MMHHILQLDTSFQRTYECEQLHEFPPAQRWYFPGASTEGGRDGIIVKVVPRDAKQWVGVFAFGKIAPREGITGLFTFPDARVLCVVVDQVVDRAAGNVIRVDVTEGHVCPRLVVVRLAVLIAHNGFYGGEG